MVYMATLAEKKTEPLLQVGRIHAGCKNDECRGALRPYVAVAYVRSAAARLATRRALSHTSEVNLNLLTGRKDECILLCLHEMTDRAQECPQADWT
jgi:hypothetical protein